MWSFAASAAELKLFQSVVVEIVSARQMKTRSVLKETQRRNVPGHVVAFQLADDPFDASPIIGEASKFRGC